MPAGPLGERCAPELVRSIMRQLGLMPLPAAAVPILDLVARDFTAAAPGEKMVGDITYTPT